MRASSRWRSHAGAISGEAIAVIVIVAAVIAAVWSIGIEDEVEEAGAAAVCALFDPDCADATDAQAQTGQQIQSQSEPETGAERRGDDRRDDARDRDEGQRGREDGRREPGRDGRRGEGDTEPPPADEGTPGPDPATTGLGDPVPGTSAAAPDPPAWRPPDAGAGEHDSEGVGWRDRLRREAVELAAHAFGLRYPDAGANLLHFLGNSGEPREQDVDRLLDEVPEFADQIDGRRADLTATALADAKAAGIDGPVTYPVSTPWVGFGYQDGGWAYDDRNWQLALGGWQSSITGTITVYPPSEPGGAWRTETRTEVHLRDQYNWDAGKSTNIAGLPVSDSDLAKLHRVGLAQEYLNTGTSSTTTTSEDHP